ncbi:MAG TPA: substrate-binding domain-containing protein [Caproicibacter sp.]|nr:substrate-binding domain-containing protein [Caproicibacter sp.]
MSKKKVILFLSFLAFFVLCYLYLNKSITLTKQSKQTYEVSVICRSENSETWSTIKQGIDQAAKDLNIDVSFITLSSRNNTKEQASLISREVNNGTDAVVIAPVDSAQLKKPIEDSLKKVPVIAMQSTVSGVSGLQTISCDNVGMGAALAKELNASGDDSSEVVVLRNSMSCTNVSDYAKGIQAELRNRRLLYCDVPDDARDAYNTVRQSLLEHPNDIFVALDAETLESVAQAKRDLRTLCQQTKIYGIGRTNKVVSFLEEKSIDAIAVENDFNLGYLCIKAAAERINNTNTGNANINYLIIKNSNMYQSDCERMLFPFVR